MLSCDTVYNLHRPWTWWEFLLHASVQTGEFRCRYTAGFTIEECYWALGTLCSALSLVSIVAQKAYRRYRAKALHAKCKRA